MLTVVGKPPPGASAKMAADDCHGAVPCDFPPFGSSLNALCRALTRTHSTWLRGIFRPRTALRLSGQEASEVEGDPANVAAPGQHPVGFQLPPSDGLERGHRLRSTALWCGHWVIPAVNPGLVCKAVWYGSTSRHMNRWTTPQWLVVRWVWGRSRCPGGAFVAGGSAEATLWRLCHYVL